MFVWHQHPIQMHYGIHNTEGWSVEMEWTWMTQSKSWPKMGEWINKRILIKPSLFGALKDSLPYVAMVDGAGQARAIQTLQKVTATPPVPITFLGSSFHLQIEQDLTSCGPIKPQRPVCSGSCYPHIWSHTHTAACLLLNLHQVLDTHWNLIDIHSSFEWLDCKYSQLQSQTQQLPAEFWSHANGCVDNNCISFRRTGVISEVGNFRFFFLQVSKIANWLKNPFITLTLAPSSVHYMTEQSEFCRFQKWQRLTDSTKE